MSAAPSESDGPGPGAADAGRARAENVRVARNALPLYAAELATRVLSLVFFIVAARALSPVVYGHLTYAVALLLFAAVAAEFGGVTLATKLVAQDPAHASRHVSAAIALRLLLGLAAFGGVVGFLSWTRPGPVVAYAGICGLAALLTTHVAPVGGALRALDWNRAEALARTVSLACGTLAALAAVLLGGGLPGIALGQSGGVLLHGVAVAVVGRRAGALERAWPAGALSAVPEFLRRSFPYGLPMLLAIAYSRQGIVVLDSMAGAGEVGIYGSAYRLIEAAYIVPGVFSVAMLPVLSATLHRGDREGAARITTSGMFLLLAVAIPFAATLSVAAGHIVALLLPGTDYAAAGPVLAIHAWSIPAVFVSGITAMLLNASPRPGANAWVSLAMVAISVALLLALTPRMGARGAALASVLTEWAGLVISAPLVRRLGGPVSYGALLGPLAAAVIAAPAFVALGETRGLLVGLPVYAAALVLLDREGRLRRALAVAREASGLGR